MVTHLAHGAGEAQSVSDIIVFPMRAGDGLRCNAFLDPANHGGEDVVLRIEGEGWVVV